MKRNLIAIALFIAIPGLSCANPTVGGPVSPDGKAEVQVDLPTELRQHNAPGRDGSGLCVFTSIEHAARWQGERRLQNFQADMRKEQGGGYPAKVDQMIQKYGKGAGYVQYEGKDDTLLRAALQSGRLPSVTYNGHDPHYGGSIAHMVNLVYLDESRACVLDNNFVGENDLVWLSRDEFHQRWAGRGEGWAVVLLAPPPPPPPHAAQPQEYAAQESAEGLYPLVPHFPIPWRPRPWISPRPPKPPAPKPVGSPAGGAEDVVWYERGGDLYLYRDGQQIGGYDVSGGFYRDYDPQTGAWGTPRIPPYLLPEGLVTNFGVGPLGEKGERYDLNGTVVGRENALAAIGAGVPNDAGLLRLTVIGAEAETKPVLADMETDSVLSTWKGRLVVQSYDPANALDAPMLRCGLPTDGKPAILIQRPDGTVLHHQRDYADGAAGLAAALRKTDPSYDPSKDTDKRQQPVLSADLGITPDQMGGFALLALTVAGAFVGKVVRS